MKLFGGLMVMLVLAGSASAAPLKHVDDGVTSAPVAPAPGEIVAYLDRPGHVVVRGEPGSLSERTVPDGCVPAAASTHSVALDCYDAAGVRESVLVDDFVTGEKTKIDTLQEPHVLDVGRHWVHISAAGGAQFLAKIGSDRVIDLADDPFGAHKIFNLNRTPPARRLCKAAHRFPGVGEEKFAVARSFGHWVLATVSDLEAELTDCRTKRHRRVSDPVVFNATHLASVAADNRIVLTRLKGGRVRRFTVQDGSGPAPLLAMSRHVLWVVTGSGELLKKQL
jgi:hypothetical protein